MSQQLFKEMKNIYSNYNQSFDYVIEFFYNLNREEKNSLMNTFIEEIYNLTIKNKTNILTHRYSYLKFKKVFENDENFGKIYQSSKNNEFKDFECVAYYLFRLNNFKNKEAFIKIFRYHSNYSESLLIDNINLNFSDSEKTEILEVLNKNDIFIQSLENRKIILDKIGLFKNYLKFKFKEESSLEELLFFMKHIKNEPLEKRVKIVYKNFFLITIKKNIHKHFHNQFFLKFLEENMDMIEDLKEYIKKRKNEEGLLILEKFEIIKNLENF